MKTKAAVLYELHKPLVIEEVEIPTLHKGQVLVKILATGVCRAQYNESIGLKGPDRYLPHLLGHEASGLVEQVGEGVTKVKKDDYVVATWIKGEGLEGGATVYKIGNKIINAGSITSFSQHAVISENRLVKISRQVPADVAALLGCAIPTGVGIIRRTLNVKKGSTVAVFGVGGVGTSAIMGAVIAGCRKVIAVDISQEKLAYAKKFGATHTLIFNRDSIVEAIRAITFQGLDYAVEAAGVPAVMEAAFESLSDTGKLAIAGNAKKGEKISLTPFDFIKGKLIVGSWGGSSVVDEDIPYYAKLYQNNKLPVLDLITSRFTLENINKALELLGKHGILGRVIIEMT